MSDFRSPSAADGFQAEDAEHAIPAESERLAPPEGFQAECAEHTLVTPEEDAGAARPS